jgi:hypothetical protein
VAVEEQNLCIFAFALVRLIPNLCHIFEHHVEEVIESSQSAGELSFAFHDDPQSLPDALVE